MNRLIRLSRNSELLGVVWIRLTVVDERRVRASSLFAKTLRSLREAVDVDSQYQSAQSVLDYFKGSNRLLGIRPEGTPYTGVRRGEGLVPATVCKDVNGYCG